MNLSTHPAQSVPVDHLRRIWPLAHLQDTPHATYLVSPTAPFSHPNPAIPLVVDYDDDHFSFQGYKDPDTAAARHANVRAWLRAADLVTTTTEHLAGVLRANGARQVHVCPNALDLTTAVRRAPRPLHTKTSVLARAVKRHARPRRRVGWSGGANQSWENGPAGRGTASFVRALGDLLGADPDLEIYLLGNLDLAAHGVYPKKYYQQRDPVPYPGDYFKALEAMDPDLAVCPLQDTPFNQGKSALKLLDWAVKEIPVVCSDTGPFAEMRRKGFPAVYVPHEDTGAWVREISRLLDNPTQARALGRDALDFVMTPRNGLVFPAAVAPWREAFASVAGVKKLTPSR